MLANAGITLCAFTVSQASRNFSLNADSPTLLGLCRGRRTFIFAVQYGLILDGVPEALQLIDRALKLAIIHIIGCAFGKVIALLYRWWSTAIANFPQQLREFLVHDTTFLAIAKTVLVLLVLRTLASRWVTGRIATVCRAQRGRQGS